jgi:hypothetical protein
LTLRALEHIRTHRVNSAWLQVRTENQSAYLLYRETGFVERSRRTTWVNQYNPAPPRMDDIQVAQRRGSDWQAQSEWLSQLYPPEVTWNLPFEIERFDPGLWRGLLRWMNGETQEHWAARSTETGNLLGVVSWEPQRSISDHVWIAAPQEVEERAIRALLPCVRQYLASRRRTITVNFPSGRAEPAFYDCGFIPQSTLVWMEHRF